MNVKEAVAHAKKYIAELYEDEQISNLGLEEVEFSDPESTWLVTVGFSRPWNTVRNVLTTIAGEIAMRRSYKVVRISDKSGEILSVKDREKALN